MLERLKFAQSDGKFEVQMETGLKLDLHLGYEPRACAALDSISTHVFHVT